MPSLSKEQSRTLTTWVQDGLSLSDIQKALSSQFELNLTYMDVRFLVDDLNLTLQDNSNTTNSVEETPEEPQLVDQDDDLPPPSNVSLTLDKIMRPGALVSGTVTFSNNTTAHWQLDQAGRIGIIPPSEDFRPPEEDLPIFQSLLQQELQKAGY